MSLDRILFGTKWLLGLPCGWAILWNTPFAIAMWSYWGEGISKLQVMNYTGLKIAKWDSETERAIVLLLWMYRHQWVLVVFAIISNLAFLFVAWRRPPAYFRWGLFFLFATPALWFSTFGFHLGIKVLTSG